ncbi:MAG: selenide, water dikinase SelD [Deltaproteobacteria bacterium]|nr:selenide, water dikinase SelD [Deltaproteobacteria bacterium]MBI2211042.1 selenide, water dikinase SelD [Deltaproteobacteria bacterium]MBI2540235.1 selenide, water dikinase SelD [Deltaproteobacteria bacterium]MBI2990727.1 selenide, water dikinase SelD [Deltaproteobacteria bacterium]
MVQVLHSLPKFEHPDMIVGVETSDDAGVFRLRSDLAIVNTVDFFTPIVDDPYVFGQIAAANALSDVYAMGGEPKTAMNIVCFPRGKMDIQILGEVLKGGAEKAREAGAVVIGGHSIIDEEIKYGMAVTGVIHPDKVIRNVGVQEGDALVLTKALGTGIITTALKRGKASKESVQAAVASMITLNKTASKVMRNYPVHACSDITGYGLLGHALGMASGSSVTLILESAKLPTLERARRLAEKGYLTGGCKRNREYLKDKITVDKSIREGLVEVAMDPQTSGGLLIALAQRYAEKLVDELKENGVKLATTVGYATSLQKAWVRLV